MICPECESENVSVQITTETETHDEYGHGTLWTVILVLWCIIVFLIMDFTTWFVILPTVLFIVSGQKKQSITQNHIALCVCQECGHVHRVHTLIPDEELKQ